VHVVHALRGVVVPLQVAIPQSKSFRDDEVQFAGSKWAGRLDLLGRLVVEMTLNQRPELASRS